MSVLVISHRVADNVSIPTSDRSVGHRLGMTLSINPLTNELGTYKCVFHSISTVRIS